MAVIGDEDMARRDYGSGSIYERKDGRFVGAYTVGWTERGTRRRVTVTAPTKAKAKVRLRKLIADHENDGGTVSPRTTVKAWADQWLPLAERDLRPSSYGATRSAITQWIVPTIGHRRLVDLTPAHVRAVTDAMRKEDRASSSQARTHSALITLLKAARAEGYAVPPRVLEVKAPRPGVSDRSDVEVQRAVAMLEVAARQPDGSRWVAAFLQGLRPGERRGLTWDAVDFERDLITISWQLQPLPYRVKRDPGSGFRVPDGYEARQVRDRWHLVRPKTSRGWRVVPMVPWLRSTLLTWREHAPDAPHGLIWYKASGDCQKADDADWRALQDAAGVRHPEGRYYGPHEARHTTATLLAEAGVEPHVIAAILGHSKMLDSYVHTQVVGGTVEALGKVADRLQVTGPDQ